MEQNRREFIKGTAWMAALAAALSLLPERFLLSTQYEKNAGRQAKAGWREGLACAASLLLFVLCILNLANASFNPFIYFRF